MRLRGIFVKIFTKVVKKFKKSLKYHAQRKIIKKHAFNFEGIWKIFKQF